MQTSTPPKGVTKSDSSITANGSAYAATRDLGSDAPVNNDIFTDPAIAQTVAEDPLFQWLGKHWRVWATVIVAALLGMYAWERFSETRDERLADYAALFQRTGEQFALVAERARELQDLKAKLLTNDEESRKKLETTTQALEDARTRLEDTLKALGDTAEPYTQFVPLYRGLSAAVAGERDKAIAALSEVDWKSASQVGQQEAFSAELAALALARVLIDDSQTFSKGWSLLKELALGGQYVYVGAVVTMVRVAETKEQKEEAQRTLEEVRSEHPSQAELLSQAISRS